MTNFILILINSVVSTTMNHTAATDRTASEAIISVYFVHTNQTNPIQVIKSFLTELSSAKSITDSFIRKHFYTNELQQIDSHVIFALEQLKKDYQTYQQEDVADAKVQKFEGIKVDPKNKFYYTDLTGDRSLSFSINQGKIAGIFMHINSEHSAYVYYSGVID